MTKVLLFVGCLVLAPAGCDSCGGDPGGGAGAGGVAGAGGTGGAGSPGAGGSGGAVFGGAAGQGAVGGAGTGGVSNTGGSGGVSGAQGQGGAGAAAGQGGMACPGVAGAPANLGNCGDGFRDPLTEECDSGGVGSACSAQCVVRDQKACEGCSLAVGRHTVAASDRGSAVVFAESGGVGLASFGARGEAGPVTHDVAVASKLTGAIHPVVAALPCGQYAVAWADDDGDELGIAVRVVTPGQAITGAAKHVNGAPAFTQRDPDILWTGTELIVAWVDDANIETAPDLRIGTFTAELKGGETTLAATEEAESHVSLAVHAGTWAAAWRASANGQESIRVKTQGKSWVLGPFLPAEDTPALSSLDATHLLVAFTEEGGALFSAVIDTSGPEGSVAAVVVVPGGGNSHPVAAGGYLAWTTTTPEEQDVWIAKLGGAPISLPRQTIHTAGDQRRPGLTLGPGGLVAVWEQLNGAKPAVGIEHIPTPILRLAGGQ